MTDVDADEPLSLPTHHLQFPSLAAGNSASKKRPNIMNQDWDDRDDCDGVCEIEVKRPNVMSMSKSHQIGNKAARFLEMKSQMEQRNPSASTTNNNHPKHDDSAKMASPPYKQPEPSANSEWDPSSEKSSTGKPHHSPTFADSGTKKPVGKLEYVINAVLSIGTENEHLRGQLGIYKSQMEVMSEQNKLSIERVIQAEKHYTQMESANKELEHVLGQHSARLENSLREIDQLNASKEHLDNQLLELTRDRQSKLSELDLLKMEHDMLLQEKHKCAEELQSLKLHSERDRAEFIQSMNEYESKMSILNRQFGEKEKALEDANGLVSLHLQKLSNLQQQYEATIIQMSELTKKQSTLASELEVEDVMMIPGVFKRLNDTVDDLENSVKSLKHESQLYSNQSEYYKDLEQKLMQFFLALGKQEVNNLEDSLKHIVTEYEGMKARLASSENDAQQKAELEKQQLRDELNRAFTFEKLKLEHELTKLRLELRRKSSTLTQSSSQLANNDIEWSVVAEGGVKSPEGSKPRRGSRAKKATVSTPKQSPAPSSMMTSGSSATTVKTKPGSPGDTLFWGPSSVFGGARKRN